MPKREVIECHITQGPIRLHSDDRLIAKRLVATGASYGRVIFSERPPLVSIEPEATNVTIAHCELIGLGGVGIS